MRTTSSVTGTESFHVQTSSSAADALLNSYGRVAGGDQSYQVVTTSLQAGGALSLSTCTLDKAGHESFSAHRRMIDEMRHRQEGMTAPIFPIDLVEHILVGAVVAEENVIGAG